MESVKNKLAFELGATVKGVEEQVKHFLIFVLTHSLWAYTSRWFIFLRLWLEDVERCSFFRQCAHFVFVIPRCPVRHQSARRFVPHNAHNTHAVMTSA